MFIFGKNSRQMIQAGVLGAGHLGKIHLRLLKESARYELVGFYDPDEIQGRKVSQEFGIPYFDNSHIGRRRVGSRTGPRHRAS